MGELSKLDLSSCIKLNYTRDTYNPISTKSELIVYDSNGKLVQDTAENRLRTEFKPEYETEYTFKSDNILVSTGSGLVKYNSEGLVNYGFYLNTFHGIGTGVHISDHMYGWPFGDRK